MRTFNLYALVLLLLLSSVLSYPSASVAQPPRSVAANVAPTQLAFRATPGELVVDNVPLGQTQQVQLLIHNDSASALAPALYEAWPAASSGLAARRSQPQRAVLPRQSARVDPQIARDLAAAPDGRAEFLVFLADQPDLAAAYTITDWNERGWFVYRTLAEHATQSQRDLRNWLDTRAIPYRAFWIVNALAVRGSSTELAALAQRADVALLRANYVSTIDLPDTHAAAAEPTNNAPSSCQVNAQGICWNIRKVGADRVWADFGVDGRGITVANIDTGVRFNHPALIQQYRGYYGPNNIVHSYNWFDPQGRSAAPSDTNSSSHGTHTMGTMVARGDGSSNQPAVGIAPGARWIAARGCRSSSCLDSDLLASSQWMLAPTDAEGNNPRPDLRPQIINNSWAGAGNDNSYAGYVNAWRAAGIIPVFAAGNRYNTTCGTIGSPADYANVLGIGSTDQDDRISNFSSVGPTYDGRLKPDLSAPGRNIASTVNSSGLSYGTLNGTSMATPLVAGAIALMMAANPTLIGDYDAIYSILTQSALPRTDSSFSGPAYANCRADTQSPNSIYGYGRLDAYAAITNARVDVPWLALPTNVAPIAPGATESITVTLDARRVPGPGTYTARVLIGNGDLSQTPLSVAVRFTVAAIPDQAVLQGNLYDAETQQVVVGTVEVADGPRINTDESGVFQLTLPARNEPYTLVGQAASYLSRTITATLSAGTQTNLPIALTADLPRVSADTTPLTATLAFDEQAERLLTVRNQGTQPLNYTLIVPANTYQLGRSDEADGPTATWIDPPPNAVRLDLTDDGISSGLALGFPFMFNGYRYRTISISANGVLAFTQIEARSYQSSCLPIGEVLAEAIVPLRLNFNPELGGTVSYAQIDAGFLVTFDQVPLANDPTQIFTFQVLLTRNDQILFNYKQLGQLSTGATAGLQRNRAEAQSLGCGPGLPLHNGLTVEWRPQVNPQVWITTPQTSGTIAAGAEVQVPILLNWVFPTGTPPFRSVVLLQSNDPRQPSVSIPVQLTPQRLPYELRLSPMYQQR